MSELWQQHGLQLNNQPFFMGGMGMGRWVRQNEKKQNSQDGKPTYVRTKKIPPQAGFSFFKKRCCSLFAARRLYTQLRKDNFIEIIHYSQLTIDCSPTDLELQRK
jgi:hypothetical protein